MSEGDGSKGGSFRRDALRLRADAEELVEAASAAEALAVVDGDAVAIDGPPAARLSREGAVVAAAQAVECDDLSWL